MVEHLFPADRQITVISEHVEVLEPCLIPVHKLDTKMTGLDHLVMEGQIYVARDKKPLPVHLPEIGDRAEIPVLLHDITVRYPDVRNLAGLYDLHVAIFTRRQQFIACQYPLAAESQERRFIPADPFTHPLGKRGVIEKALLLPHLVTQTLHG